MKYRSNSGERQTKLSEGALFKNVIQTQQKSILPILNVNRSNQHFNSQHASPDSNPCNAEPSHFPRTKIPTKTTTTLAHSRKVRPSNQHSTSLFKSHNETLESEADLGFMKNSFEEGNSLVEDSMVLG
jgi:hypothetical protein